MNTECNRIADQLGSNIEGQAWYGSSLREIVEKVTAKQAHARPISNAHSTWEIVHHLDAWVKFALGAIQGKPIPAWPGMANEQDWPPVIASSEEAWQQAVNSLLSNYRKLVKQIKATADERLDATVPGRAYNFYHLFQSMMQHAVYHSGQIALLNKMTSI
jgi:uncharacterized damage-inducible protein DinB